MRPKRILTFNTILAAGNNFLVLEQQKNVINIDFMMSIYEARSGS